MGVLGFFLLGHFFFDWGLQSHKDAIAKSKNFSVRFSHVLSYTLCMSVLFYVVMSDDIFGIFIVSSATAVLHFLTDDYSAPVLWAKYVRKAPEFEGIGILAGATKFAATPLGIILLVMGDQLLHTLALSFVAFYVVSRDLSIFLWASAALGEALLLSTFHMYRQIMWDLETFGVEY